MRLVVGLLFSSLALLACKPSSKVENTAAAPILPDHLDAGAHACQALESDAGDLDERFEAVLGNRRDLLCVRRMPLASVSRPTPARQSKDRFDLAGCVLRTSDQRAGLEQVGVVACADNVMIVSVSMILDGGEESLERALVKNAGTGLKVVEHHALAHRLPPTPIRPPRHTSDD